MSKKHNKVPPTGVVTTESAQVLAEDRIIKRDLARVVLINLVFLAAILFLYKQNHATGFLEKWFVRTLGF